MHDQFERTGWSVVVVVVVVVVGSAQATTTTTTTTISVKRVLTSTLNINNKSDNNTLRFLN
jgi:hypothetical protein